MAQEISSLRWSQRFALMDHYDLDDKAACDAFGITESQLKAAHELRSQGMVEADQTFPVNDYRHLFVEEEQTATPTRAGFGFAGLVGQLIGEPPAITRKHGTGRVHKISGTAGSSSASQPKQRGRRGTKIAEAFLAIPSQPVLLDEFLATHNVSINVLRQSRRFDTTGRGPVNIKKINGQQMIWRTMIDPKPSTDQ